MDRAALINSLSAEFEKDKGVPTKIDRSNYIDSTNSLDCTANAIPVAHLQKTKNVILQMKDHVKKTANADANAAQQLIHLDIVLKCIEQVISENSKQ